MGDLDDSGEMCVVVGTADGLAIAFDADGNILPGWPVDTETGASVYVSIGALGGPEPRTVVLGAGDLLTFRNKQGEMPDGAYYRLHGGRTHRAPSATSTAMRSPRWSAECRTRSSPSR